MALRMIALVGSGSPRPPECDMSQKITRTTPKIVPTPRRPQCCLPACLSACLLTYMFFLSHGNTVASSGGESREGIRGPSRLVCTWLERGAGMCWWDDVNSKQHNQNAKHFSPLEDWLGRWLYLYVCIDSARCHFPVSA